MSVERVEMEWAGRTLSLETGALARQADAAVVIRYGDTVALVTAVAGEARLGVDFLPLRIDFEEKMYAVGKIPGSFFRREGRPGEDGTVTCRKIDHTTRPLLPSGFRNELQVIATVLSVSPDDSHNLASLIGTAAALGISPVPFAGPLAAAEVGIVDDEFVLNPPFEVLDQGPMDLLVACTRQGIVMMELEGDQLPEERVVAALEFAQQACAPVLDLLDEFARRAGQPKREDFTIFTPDPDVMAKVEELASERVRELLNLTDKQEMWTAYDSLKAELTTQLAEQFPDSKADVAAATGKLLKRHVRTMVLQERRRPDGRQRDEVRPISCQVGLLPRAHGSGLFTRGETQALTIATLGAIRDQQLVRTLQEPEEMKRYMHHYNFPPFCTGEQRPLRGPSRREIGHGALAEKALARVMPAEQDFPYTIRLVSEILESNGSSSMASVCGSTLALMDAGVPVRAPVAGVSVGLIYESPEEYALLTDIQGVEDFEGHMDFKIAGTRTGVTAIQLDEKVQGLPLSVLAEALQYAKAARNRILDELLAVLPGPRVELSPYAPRIYTIVIDREKIGLVIGPGGKMVRKIQEECGVNIDIEDDGTIYVTAQEGAGAERAQTMIRDLTREVEVGETFNAKVVKCTPFGAFCEIAPGKEGLIHISQLAWEHTERTEDVVNVGDEVQVKVVEVDPMGKIRLSRKALLPRPPGAGRDTGEGHGPPPRPSGPPRREGGGPPREHDRPRRDDNDEGGAKPYFRERRGRS